MARADEHSEQTEELMRRCSVPIGRTGRGEQVYAFRRSPDDPPVACARMRDARTPTMGAHAHDFLVLCYAHRADGAVLIDGRLWRIGDGDLFVLAPGTVIDFPETHETIEDGWVVWFPADTVGAGTYGSWRTHPLLHPFTGGVQRLRVPPDDRDAWPAAFAALDAELRGHRAGHREAALAHLTLLLVGAGRLNGDAAARPDADPLLASVFDVIERRYHEPISLTDVAADLALTPGHLTTVVRRRTGRTVQQWITQRRLREARDLLDRTDLTVAAISRRVGYPDVGYFIKRFRAEHRTTPARWRAA